MASSSEGRILLYLQETKREHKHLMKKSEQLTESLRRVDTLYNMMQEHELKMNGMDEKLVALAEYDGVMADSFDKMGSENHVHFEKVATELHGLSHKILRLEALEKEHSMRFQSNVPLFKEIQKRLEQLENAAEDLAKKKGKVTKRSEEQNVDRLVEEIGSLRAFVQDQERNWRNLRDEVHELKLKRHQAARTISQATTQTDRQVSDVTLAPAPQARNNPTTGSRPVSSRTLQKRQTIQQSRPARKSTHVQAIPGAARRSPHPRESVPKGLSMVQVASQKKSPGSTRTEPLMQRQRAPMLVRRRLQDELSESPSARKKRKSRLPLDAIPVRHANAAPIHTYGGGRLTLHMNQSYPQIQVVQPSSDSINAMSQQHGAEQQAEAGLLTPKPSMEYRIQPVEVSAHQRAEYPTASDQKAAPRKRKKRELPPMPPLPPYED